MVDISDFFFFFFWGGGGGMADIAYISLGGVG